MVTEICRLDLVVAGVRPPGVAIALHSDTYTGLP